MINYFLKIYSINRLTGFGLIIFIYGSIGLIYKILPKIYHPSLSYSIFLFFIGLGLCYKGIIISKVKNDE